MIAHNSGLSLNHVAPSWLDLRQVTETRFVDQTPGLTIPASIRASSVPGCIRKRTVVG